MEHDGKERENKEKKGEWQGKEINGTRKSLKK